MLRLALLAVLATGVAAAAPTPPKTIVIVRHAEAEAETPGSDPPLSERGRARAAELARVLGESPLRAVYCTKLQRSRLTAEPLARRAGDAPTVVDDVPATLAALRAQPLGTTEVVVGHSNTVPKLVEGLTGQPFPDQAVAFDGMWIVTVAEGGGASVLRLRYGAPSR